MDLNKIMKYVYLMASIMMTIGIAGNIYSTYVLAWHNWILVQKITWFFSSLSLNIIFLILFAALYRDMAKRDKAIEAITMGDVKELLNKYGGTDGIQSSKSPPDGTKN